MDYFLRLVYFFIDHSVLLENHCLHLSLTLQYTLQQYSSLEQQYSMSLSLDED